MSETIKRKLIEVALPLEAINKESAKEKSIRHGHPSNLHQWWARRPLAACRAVLFASLVDDPSSNPTEFPTEVAQQTERQRLFSVIEDLVKWENANSESVLERARAEIRRSTEGQAPAILDPFCGGGSIPMEAHRLGLDSYGSDLNPVAVLVTRGVTEIPERFLNSAPVHPKEKGLGIAKKSKGAGGLAEDIQYYGEWVRQEAIKTIGALYPSLQIPSEQGGGQVSVVSWLWTRTVKCPNPACGAVMPLARSYSLCAKKGKECWAWPTPDKTKKRIRFEIVNGVKAPPATKIGRGAKFLCLVCASTVDDEYVKAEGLAHRLGTQLMAIVGDRKGGRVYCAPDGQHDEIAESASPSWIPEEELPFDPRNIWCTGYGLTRFKDLFTKRQLAALGTFSELVGKVREQVIVDGKAAGLKDDGVSFSAGGQGATAYGDAIATYLAFAVDKLADLGNSICPWEPVAQCPRNMFGRQAIPMSWNFAEGNPLGNSSGSWKILIDNLSRNLNATFPSGTGSGKVSIVQQDAATLESQGKLVATDPPYYDNVGYADLSDFFYVWLRRSLCKVYPELFTTLLVPKSNELVVNPYRFGGDKQKAQDFFEEGLGKAFKKMKEAHDARYPLIVFYAFKQSENDTGGGSTGVVSTGWETMLESLLQTGLCIVGTWPMRTEMVAALKAGFNNLASSIVMVCRPRAEKAEKITRRELIGSLKKELPDAIKKLQEGSIAPVDLAQAAIGPGMAIYSRYAEVLESDGSLMSVRSALQLINSTLDEVLSEQDSDYDPDTRWAVSWFEQHGFTEGAFGVAEVLSKAKDTALSGLVEAGIVESRAGKVRLYKRNELDSNWDPLKDKRLTVWEVTHYLIRALEEGGKAEAAVLMQKVGNIAETAQELAYRLYGICERKKWPQDGLAYNGLVVSWSEIKASMTQSGTEPKQLQTSDI